MRVMSGSYLPLHKYLEPRYGAQGESMPMKDIVNRRVRSLFVGGAVALACGAVVI
jgi:hypothetical protein